MKKILIANRGEIACRIIRTCRKMGLASVAIYSKADENTAATEQADEAFFVDSYLNIDAILNMARERGVDGIHPGYGFNSENANFAELCRENNIVFIGPNPESMRQFSLKHDSRALAESLGVPTVPGSAALLDSDDEARSVAAKIGYPIMVKATAGGGGIGMYKCEDEASLIRALSDARAKAERFFKQGGVFLEKYIERPRHIEVQVFNTSHLGERECSIQRRNQKVIEETPAVIDETLRKKLWDAAVKLTSSVGYTSAGTVEFIVDAQNNFYFLEMNTRLQVEHGVTEMVTGIDLVEWMIQPPDLSAFIYQPKGHSIQCRVYAEDPAKKFMPSPGTITTAVFPVRDGVRYDTWIKSGTVVTPFYDPMLAKILVHGSDRLDAIRKMRAVLEDVRVEGVTTNLGLLRQVFQSQAFADAKLSTQFLREEFGYVI